MFDPLLVIIVFLVYIGVLFLIAEWTERGRGKSKTLAKSAVTYSLALAVFCTSWTYYGSVGKATTSGMLFLSIYLGSTLSVILWWVTLRKMVKIKNTQRISSIAEFISTRYNKSRSLAALVTAIALVGIMPYTALQLKSITTTFALITTSSQPIIPWIGDHVNIIVIGLMILFTIMFGVRRLDPTERHEGMLMALAVESIVKLVAFLIAGVFVTYFVYDGFDDIFQRLAVSPYQSMLSMGGAETSSYLTWSSYLILAASAEIFLPRQFHVAVVENSNPKQISTAMWLFPLYMFLINIFVFPIAAGGLLAGLPAQAADTFVLRIPLQYGNELMVLLVFIGGFSAATGMVMVSSMTLSTMITNNLLLPLFNQIEKLSFLRRHLLKFRWGAVALVILLGYWFEQSVGNSYMLVNIGMISFAAALQFAPAILGGIFWEKGNKPGAILGLSAGFLIWLYTLFIPSFIRSGWLPIRILQEGPWGIHFLKPEQLFGVQGLDPLSHAIFWSLFFNLGLYILGSLLFAQSEEESALAAEFVGALERKEKALPIRREAYIPFAEKQSEINDLLAQYFPPSVSQRIIQECAHATGLENKILISITDLVEFHSMIEKRLAGSIGTAAAQQAIKSGTQFTPKQSQDLGEIYGEILADLRVTPDDLKRKVDYFQERETLLSQHAEELKKKIMALDEQIIERIQAEEALRESEQKLASIIDFLPDATFVINQHSEVIAWNQAIEVLTGVKAADILGKGNYEYALPFYGERRPLLVDMVLQPEAQLEHKYIQFKREKKTITGETYVSTPKSEEQYLLASAAPLYNSKGMAVGAIEIVHDITERKQSEEELQHLRHFLTNIIDSMPSILVGIDPQGQVTQWNSEAQRAMDISAAEAIGQPLKKVFPRLSSEMPYVKIAMQTGKVQLNPKRAWQQDGETRYEDVTIYPLITDRLEGVVIRLDDITDQVRIEEMMVQNEKMLSVGGLAAGMAHEINNPLAGMMQTADVMTNRLSQDLPANLRAAEEAGTSMPAIRAFMQARGIPRMLTDIRQSGHRIAEIVANMLSFARRSEAEFSSHDIAELLEKALELAATDYDLKKQYDFKTIQITKEFEPDLPLVSCEGGKIQQVFLNILRNGAHSMQRLKAEDDSQQHMEAQKPRLILRIAHEPENRSLRIEIEDNGPGMDEATRKRVFEPFFTTKPVGEGTGLGLSVSYFIITENHGGSLDVISEPGQGANFIIRLPLEKRAILHT